MPRAWLPADYACFAAPSDTGSVRSGSISASGSWKCQKIIPSLRPAGSSQIGTPGSVCANTILKLPSASSSSCLPLSDVYRRL